jgi:hypothetical protein
MDKQNQGDREETAEAGEAQVHGEDFRKTRAAECDPRRTRETSREAGTDRKPIGVVAAVVVALILAPLLRP